jgi:hypothetical protein
MRPYWLPILIFLYSLICVFQHTLTSDSLLKLSYFNFTYFFPSVNELFS